MPRTINTGPGLRERSKQRRTARILSAALELIREDPGRSPTVERIAERAEVAPMTVFNLVGNREQMWTALADHALRGFDPAAIEHPDPHERARRIVDAATKALCADSDVFRVLLAGWGHGGRLLRHDPTPALIECLAEAELSGDLTPRRYGEIISAGLIGTIQQWTAGLLSDRAFRARARDVVDVVFAAARGGAATGSV